MAAQGDFLVGGDELGALFVALEDNLFIEDEVFFYKIWTNVLPKLKMIQILKVFRALFAPQLVKVREV